MAPRKQKSAPRNAFYYFMLHLQKTQGRQYAGGLREVSLAAGPMWDNMNASEKQPFELMARRERSGVKYTTQGQTFDEIIQEQKELKEKEELMQSTIKNTLIQLGRNTGFSTAPFFLVHVNFFCKKDDGTFYPSEFALTQFSIARGVQHVYHTIVDLSDLPQGYTLKAMDHSKDTHQIPLPPNVPHGVKDSHVIMEKIHKYVYQFQEDCETMPPFYTLAQLIPSTDNMMSRWALDFGRNSDYFRIFPLEQLLFDMKMFSLKPENQRPIIRGVRDDGFLHLATAQSLLQEDLFMYRLGIACDFHEEQDNVTHCSKSYVTRWGWTLANHLCCNMDVRMIPGQHCPKETIPEDLWIDNQGLQDLATGGRQEPAPNRRGRTEHPPSRAFGRGKPIKLSPDNADAVNGTTSVGPSGFHNSIEVINHGASKAAKAGTGRGLVRPPQPAQSAWGAGGAASRHSETGGLASPALPAQSAWGVGDAASPQHPETGNRKWGTEQFADAPANPSVKRDMSGPVRMPNTQPQRPALAMEVGWSVQPPGASFSAEDFPAFGRGNDIFPPGFGRQGAARSGRGGSRGVGPSRAQ